MIYTICLDRLTDHQPIRLSHLRCNFRQVFCMRHADPDGKAKLAPHTAADRLRNFGGRTFVSGHFKEYERLGNAAIEVVCNFTLVERISIDEAFADVAGCAGLFG